MFPRRHLAWVFIFLFLSACSKKNDFEINLQQYRDHLSQVVQKDIPLIPIDKTTLRYPARRDIRIEREEETIGFTEFFQLSHCEISRVVAEHNSLLNKHQGPSELLFHDLQFLANVSACKSKYNDTHEREEGIKILQKAAKEKRILIGNTLWNASFASKEFTDFFSPYGVTPTFQPSQATHILAIGDLAQGILHEGERYAASRKEFDLLLGKLAKERAAGAVLLTISQSLSLLESTESHQRLNCSLLKAEQAALLNQHFDTLLSPYFETTLGAITAIRKVYTHLQTYAAVPHAFTEYWETYWTNEGKSLAYNFEKALTAHQDFLKSINDCRQHKSVQS